MLDLARVENRQKHNSDEIDACIVNVETAIQSEEVCGAKYHKCLDYGQFIDVTTGAPLTGVANFYELAQLLTFKNTENIKDQKLSTLSNNRTFVQFFENKTKKFAKDALDKCSEKADFVWQQYLDRALLDIYYAQRSKVEEIQKSCISLVTECYTNQGAAITAAMAALSGDYTTNLKPGVIELTTEMCDDYITSCNNMFGEDVIKKYIKNKDDSDSVTACRAVVQQCFDNFGGTGYENFYYPYSGLFEIGFAIDWFTLYEYEPTTTEITDLTDYYTDSKTIISPCAKELAKTDGCNSAEILEKVFGGFDRIIKEDKTYVYFHNSNNNTDYEETRDTDTRETISKITAISNNREPRSTGVATETYYKIIDNLSTQCKGLNGYFVENQFIEQYSYLPSQPCKIDTSSFASVFRKNSENSEENTLDYWYRFYTNENMCPANYTNKVDVASWGVCSCWENGGFRSKNGKSATCLPLLPYYTQNEDTSSDVMCSDIILSTESSSKTKTAWCQNNVISSLGQVCPRTSITETSEENPYMYCAKSTDGSKTRIEVVYTDVPHHKTSSKSETSTRSTTTTSTASPSSTGD
jgi:hypothetical protein